MRTPSGPVVVGFPLRGEWVTVRTPAHKIPSHGTDLFGHCCIPGDRIGAARLPV